MNHVTHSLKAAWLILMSQTGYWTLHEINSELTRRYRRLAPVQAQELEQLALEGCVNHRASRLSYQADTFNVDQTCYPLRCLKLGDMGLLTDVAA